MPRQHDLQDARHDDQDAQHFNSQSDPFNNVMKRLHHRSPCFRSEVLILRFVVGTLK